MSRAKSRAISSSESLTSSRRLLKWRSRRSRLAFSRSKFNNTALGNESARRNVTKYDAPSRFTCGSNRACECQSEVDFEFRPLHQWHAIDDVFAPSRGSAGLWEGAAWPEIARLRQESERAVVG